jgi:hypothetical protein
MSDNSEDNNSESDKNDEQMLKKKVMKTLGKRGAIKAKARRVKYQSKFL